MTLKMAQTRGGSNKSNDRRTLGTGDSHEGRKGDKENNSKLHV